jgi:hypothetical protein
VRRLGGQEGADGDCRLLVPAVLNVACADLKLVAVEQGHEVVLVAAELLKAAAEMDLDHESGAATDRDGRPLERHDFGSLDVREVVDGDGRRTWTVPTRPALIRRPLRPSAKRT